MAIDPKKLKEVNALLKSLNTEFSKLGKTNPFKNIDPSQISDIDAEIKKMKSSLKGVKAENEEFNKSLDDTYTSFTSIVSELGKTNSGLKESKKIYSDSAAAARKLRDHQDGISTLSVKQLKNEKAKVKSAQGNLKSAQQALSEDKKKLLSGRKYNELQFKEKAQYSDIQKAIEANQRAIDGKENAFGKINKQLDEEIKKEAKIQKDLGIMGGVLKGISKIPILGDVLETGKATEAMEDSLRNGGSQTKALAAGIKSMGASLLTALGPANLIFGAIAAIVDLFMKADKQAGEFAKGMNMTYNESVATRQEMSEIAANSIDASTGLRDAALNGGNLMQTSMEVGKALGTNAKLNKEDLKTMTKLTHQAGFTADEIMNIQKLSLANGKSLKANTKEILGGAKEYARRNKIAVNEKTILREVNKMSASLKLSLGASGDAMAKAAVQAKAFGINLEQAEKISDSLLDFEQSIENEMAAELLTGKDLNFEKARGLALSGDAAGAAAEILKQAQDLTEEQLKNPIIMGSMAKAAGLTREELAASIIESRALQSIGAASVEDAETKYNKLRETMSAEEALAEFGDEQLARQFEQQNVAEQTKDNMALLSESFVGMLPALQTISDVMGTVAKYIGYVMDGAKSIIGFFRDMGKGLNNFLGGSKALVYTFKGLVIGAGLLAAYMAYASLAAIPIVGAVAGGIASAVIIAASFAAANQLKANDMFSAGGGGSGGYGKRTLMGPEGAIQLNNKDDVIAGTDLFGKKKQSGTSGSSINVDMTQTNALLQQLIQILTAGGDVLLDGQKVGEALGLTAYKIN